MSELLSKSNSTQTKSTQSVQRPAARPQAMQQMQQRPQQRPVRATEAPVQPRPQQRPVWATEAPVQPRPQQRPVRAIEAPVQPQRPHPQRTQAQRPAAPQPAAPPPVHRAQSVQRPPVRPQQPRHTQQQPRHAQQPLPSAARPVHRVPPAGRRRSAVKTSLKVVRVAVVLAALLVVTTGIISAVVLLNPSEPAVPDVSVGISALAARAAAASSAPSGAPVTTGDAAAQPEPEPSDAAEEAPAAELVSEAAAPEGKYTVTFTFYKKDPVTCSTGARTVGELADLMHLELTDEQRKNVDPDAVITEDTTVSVDAVTYGTVNVTEAIPFETRYVDVQTIPRGSTRVDQAGQNGVRTYEYQITYLNGVEMDRALAREYVSQNPTEQVITRGVGGTLTVGGKTYNYSYYIDCRATVYTGGGTTASGMPASERCIAVDPRVIPLGTQVYISGSYCDVGFRTAADTGGSIKGNIIDIYFETGNPYLGGWGWRDMRVYLF